MAQNFPNFSQCFLEILSAEDEKTDNKVKKKIPIRGENVETEINMSIEETYYGSEKKISLRTLKGKMKTFVVKVPAGIRNQEKIRLIGQGKAGINGGKNGDLFIKVNIQNSKRFRLEWNRFIHRFTIDPMGSCT